MNKQQYIIRNESIKANCVNAIESLGYEKPMRVTIEEYKTNRTLAQNSLLWLWMTELSHQFADAYGEHYSPETWKILMQDKFLGKEAIQSPLGGVLLRDKGTSTLKVGEFTDFLESIDFYVSADLKLTLPHPVDLIAEAYGRKEVA